MYKLLFLLLFISSVLSEEVCVVYDNSTDISDFFNSYFTEVGQQNATVPSDRVNYSNYTLCENYPNFDPNRVRVIYIINNKETLLNLNISDTAISQWLKLTNSYTGNICNPPPSYTMGILCGLVYGASYFAKDIDSKLYMNETLPPERITNTSLYKFMNYADHWNASIGKTYSFANIFGLTSYTYKHFINHYQSTGLYHMTFNNITEDVMDDLHGSLGRLKHHIQMPYHFVKNQWYRKDLRNVVSKYTDQLGFHIRDTVRNTKRSIQRYKAINLKFREGVSFGDGLSHYANQINHHIGNFSALNWDNYAGTNRVIYVDNPTDMYNWVSSLFSGLFYINNAYNESGCLGSGGLRLPVFNALCKKPIFLAHVYASFWPVGFDPRHPQCEDYYNPVIYVKSTFYALSYWTNYGSYLDVHDGFQFATSWAVHNFTGDRQLPPNLVPCVIMNWLMPLLAISILFAIFSFCGCSFRVATKIQERVFEYEDLEKQDSPDILQLIPKPPTLFETGQSGVNMITNSLSKVQSSIQTLGSVGSGGSQNITPKIPKLPKLPRIK